jgi:hypothetical protein
MISAATAVAARIVKNQNSRFPSSRKRLPLAERFGEAVEALERAAA